MELKAFWVKYWEWLAGAFVAGSFIYWLGVLLGGYVAPDRYTATDAANDRTAIEREIEQLRNEILEALK